MKVYLVICDWQSEITVGVFSTLEKAREARDNHLKWMFDTTISLPKISKNDYLISEITLDENVDEWYNDYIKRKGR